MKRHIACVVYAALIVGIAMLVMLFAQTRRELVFGLLTLIAFAPLFPAWLLIGFFGLTRGPDGVPSMNDTFVAAFVFWWLAIEFWRRVNEQYERQRSAEQQPSEARHR